MSIARHERIALLGCGGFIGSYLLERILTTTGYHVEGIDLTLRKIEHLLGHPQLHFHCIDVHDAGAIRPIFERCGTVMSLAALCNPYLYTHTPIKVIESNFVAMYPLVRMCSELGCRLIHFSSSEVYGRTLEGSIDAAGFQRTGVRAFNENETPLLLGPVRAQRWCYACAKQLLERTIFAYGFERDLDYTIIRPFNFIGPRMDFIPGVDGDGVPRVLACFMDALLNRRPMLLVDGGKNRRCFTAICDAVDAVMLILHNPGLCRRRIFNIGNPANETTIADLAELMSRLYRELRPGKAGDAGIFNTVSSNEFYGEGYEDSDRRLPDISAISDTLGWSPKIGLVDAVRAAMIGFIEMYGRRCSPDGDAFSAQVREGG